MRIIGKNSILYWSKYPFLVCTIGFMASSAWICGLIVLQLITGKFHSLVTVENINEYKIIQFKYPFSQMVFTAENSTEGILLAFWGLISVSFVLLYSLRIIRQFANDHIFSSKVVTDFKTLSMGFIIFASVILFIDLTVERSNYDFTLPLWYMLAGFVLLFIKEIVDQGKILQDQTDLTI
ncbi:DUF2975 domain-containing protein [Algoriphagus resistens]|uniref:DUF2975 domain-containing protein n=1 Tax=Algoriphagus resistens TaxID=1750590 RepID=UPI000716C4FC|nr:DUF2975 domain-containing protein [Algoriphagus resistens]